MCAYHGTLGWSVYPHNPLRPVIAGKTRWWSTKKQNKRFVRLKPALVPTLEELLDIDDIPIEKKLYFDFSAADWKVMEQIDDILEPFKAAIKELEGEKYPTLPMVTMHVFTLQEFIQNRLDSLNANSEWSTRIRSFLRLLKTGIDTIVAGVPEEAYIASLLDPRFLDTFIPVAQREGWWRRLDELIEERNIDQGDPIVPDPPEAGNPAPVPQPPRAGTRSQPTVATPKLSYADLMSRKFSAKGISQAEKTPYRNLTPVGRKLDPLKWWKLNETTYKAHSILARRYLAIPASSAPCERVFSTAGRVIEKRRASLKPDTAKAIVFLHENFHLLDELEHLEENLNDEYERR